MAWVCIKYKLEWEDEPRQQGPYPETESESHRQDIAGYEGVEYARAIPVTVVEELSGERLHGYIRALEQKPCCKNGSDTPDEGERP